PPSVPVHPANSAIPLAVAPSIPTAATLPEVSVLPGSTALTSAALPDSAPDVVTGSSLPASSPPACAGVTAAGAGRAAPNSVPTTAEIVRLLLAAATAPHHAGPSSACALPERGSCPHRPATARVPTRPTDARTRVYSHILPSPPEPGLRAGGKTGSLRWVSASFPCAPPFLCRPWQFVGTPDGNRSL